MYMWNDWKVLLFDTTIMIQLEWRVIEICQENMEIMFFIHTFQLSILLCQV